MIGVYQHQPDQRHLSIAEAAKEFGVNRSTVHRWVHGNPSKGIPPSKILVWHIHKNISRGFLLGKDCNKFYEQELS